jgi:hypothetical protein
MNAWILLLFIPIFAFAGPIQDAKESATEKANQELLTEGGGGTIIGGGGDTISASIKTNLLRRALTLTESQEDMDPERGTYTVLLQCKIERVNTFTSEISVTASDDVDIAKRHMVIWVPKTLSESDATEKIWQYLLENYYE